MPITIDTFFGKNFGLKRKKVLITVSDVVEPSEIIDLKNPNPTVEDFRGASQKVLNIIKSNFR